MLAVTFPFSTDYMKRPGLLPHTIHSDNSSRCRENGIEISLLQVYTISCEFLSVYGNKIQNSFFQRP